MDVLLNGLSWVMILAGSAFTIVGAVGIMRMPDLFTRMHATSVTDTLGAGLLLLVIRPFVHIFNEGVINQVVVPQLTNRIRWRTHLYTLGHSLSYFQGDFAGRLANRITQVGPALRDMAVQTLDVVVFVAVYALVAVSAFSTAR